MVGVRVGVRLGARRLRRPVRVGRIRRLRGGRNRSGYRSRVHVSPPVLPVVGSVRGEETVASAAATAATGETMTAVSPGRAMVFVVPRGYIETGCWKRDIPPWSKE